MKLWSTLCLACGLAVMGGQVLAADVAVWEQQLQAGAAALKAGKVAEARVALLAAVRASTADPRLAMTLERLATVCEREWAGVRRVAARLLCLTSRCPSLPRAGTIPPCRVG